MKKLLKTSEAAAHLNVHRMTLLEWRRQGMPFETTPGGHVRYDMEKVKKWIKQHKKGTA